MSYDAHNKSLIDALGGHKSWVLSLTASPDGAALVTDVPAAPPPTEIPEAYHVFDLQAARKPSVELAEGKWNDRNCAHVRIGSVCEGGTFHSGHQSPPSMTLIQLQWHRRYMGEQRHAITHESAILRLEPGIALEVAWDHFPSPNSRLR